MAYDESPLTTDASVLGRMGPADFFAATRRRGRLARGSAATASAWTLTDAGSAVGTFGIPAGTLGLLTPTVAEDALVVAVVSGAGDTLTLRLADQDEGVGQPIEAVSAGPWRYEFSTAKAVIARESANVRGLLSLRSDEGLDNPGDPEYLTRLRVAAALYFAASKEATAAERDTYFSKYKELVAEIKEEAKRLLGKYPGGEAVGQEFAVFGLDGAAYTYPACLGRYLE